MGESLASLCGFSCLPQYFRLPRLLDDVSHWQHPLNQVGTFTDWPLITDCFGAAVVGEALGPSRATFLTHYRVRGTRTEQVHACDFLSDSIDSAAIWTTLFNSQGAELLFPYLDSRLLRLVFSMESRKRFPFRRPERNCRKPPCWRAA